MNHPTIKLDTEKLALPRGRRVGQPGHASSILLLTKRMHENGMKPFKGNSFSLEYSTLNGKTQEIFTNLAGFIKGTDSNLDPLLIGAHYDSAIDAPCADDNAVSVAVILEIANHLKLKPINRNVVFVFFDAEERPFFGTERMGSIRFYKDHCQNLTFATVIILDMIGHDVSLGNKLLDFLFPKVKEFLFIQGSESHHQLPPITRRCLKNIKNLKIISLLNKYTGDHSDHMIFREVGIPYLFLCKGWGIHSHTAKDTINWVNFDRVSHVYELVISIINHLDKIRIDKEKHKFDPFTNDINLMKKAIGFLFPFILFLIMYKTRLESRKDIDKLSEKLKSIYNKRIK